MATYPGAIVAFATHNTGDTIQASDVNTPNAEIVAVETGLLNGFQHNITPDTDLGRSLGTNALRFTFPAGVVGAPTLNFGDGTTGFYRNGANNISIAVAGAQAFTFNATGLQILAGYDLFTSAQWQDFSGSSTIVGWASFTTKSLYYKRVGNMVFVTFNFQGTSNATGATFTLPTASNATNPQMNVAIAAEDNGAVVGSPIAQLAAGSSTVSCFKDVSGTAWTNSGTKIATGQFFYQV